MLSQMAKHLEDNLRTFDPADIVDLRHYYSLRYQGRQLERRYVLEQPFPDVISMMHHKIAANVLSQVLPGVDLTYGA